MSYTVYTTRGFILQSSPSGEASKSYLIYTADFGLIRASAQGVRHLKSKLRFNLEDFSYASISFVKGKEMWRITGATSIGSPSNPQNRAIRGRILSLVRRLVQGEERNDDLFSVMESLFADDVPQELDVLARTLSSLGYMDLTSLDGLGDKEKIVAINKALKETHL